MEPDAGNEDKCGEKERARIDVRSADFEPRERNRARDEKGEKPESKPKTRLEQYILGY